jgi:dTDP-4-amino-4,6-dideoxygalactose transaminase
VTDALLSGWITTGPKTKELERLVARRCGTEYAVCLNSQTACAEMALRLMGIGPGDEVITTAYTYTATASVICHVGAKPVLIDTQPDSLEMDYDAMEAAINERTKVIIPVDLAGIPCDYARIFAALAPIPRNPVFPGSITSYSRRSLGTASFWHAAVIASETVLSVTSIYS